MIPWITVTLLLFVIWFRTPRLAGMSPLERSISHQYDLSDLDASLLDISGKIMELTPEDAILLAPPLAGQLRYTAKRAIVVSFKTYPFKGEAMKEWRQRMFDCYSWTDLEGFNAVSYSFEPAYRKIDKEKLMKISEKYHATFAVLYSETETALPVLYKNDQYQLVSLTDN